MAFCPHCGTQSPDNYTQCPNCGASLPQMQTPPPQPVYQGPPQNPYAGAYPGGPQPMMQPQDAVTSAGAWFGWTMLLGILPVIGAIIMLSASNDPSAKNYAKLMLILQAVVVGLYILFFVFVFTDV